MSEAKQRLGVDWHQLQALTRIELLDRQWRDGRRQAAVKLPGWLLERGLGPSGMARP